MKEYPLCVIIALFVAIGGILISDLDLFPKATIITIDSIAIIMQVKWLSYLSRNFSFDWRE